MHMSVPSNMYGLRRPKREVELSAKAPGPQQKVLTTTTAKKEVLLTDERLHDEAWQRTSDEDNGHTWLWQSEWKEIWWSYETIMTIRILKSFANKEETYHRTFLRSSRFELQESQWSLLASEPTEGHEPLPRPWTFVSGHDLLLALQERETTRSLARITRSVVA